jgi:hypothetical protein
LEDVHVFTDTQAKAILLADVSTEITQQLKGLKDEYFVEHLEMLQKKFELEQALKKGFQIESLKELGVDKLRLMREKHFSLDNVCAFTDTQAKTIRISGISLEVAQQLKGVKEEYSVHCLQILGNLSYSVLLKELKIEQVLKLSDDKLYLFARYPYRYPFSLEEVHKLTNTQAAAIRISEISLEVAQQLKGIKEEYSVEYLQALQKGFKLSQVLALSSQVQQPINAFLSSSTNFLGYYALKNDLMMKEKMTMEEVENLKPKKQNPLLDEK